ncbi:MAG: DUF4956 domain-containing protein [bacterium]|nr:DUF4956 domain-containing protein [bacterium]
MSVHSFFNHPVMVAAQSSVWQWMQDFANGDSPHVVGPKGGVNYADTFPKLFLAMSVAALLGAMLAYHPKRRHDPNGGISDTEVKKTQILICVAGAIIFPLIRGDLALAFGLAGMGGFVRYRTALSNPVDLSMLFILIGLGMACGLQYYPVAFAITAFIYMLLYILELPNGARQYKWDLRIYTNDPKATQEAFLKMAKQSKYNVVKKRTSEEQNRFICKFITNSALNTEEIAKKLQANLPEGVQITNIDWSKG